MNEQKSSAVKEYARKNKVNLQEVASCGGVARVTLYRHIKSGMGKREETRYLRIIDDIVRKRELTAQEKPKRKSRSIANFNSDGQS